MKNEVYLDFCLWGFEDITPDAISERLGIKPVKVYVTGEKVNPKFARVSKRNGWRMSAGMEKYSSFEDQMNMMLNIIESKIDLFRPLCQKYYSEFSCAVYIRYGNEESTPWVHLDARYNRLIKDLNIEFDLDLYCLPNSD